MPLHSIALQPSNTTYIDNSNVKRRWSEIIVTDKDGITFLHWDKNQAPSPEEATRAVPPELPKYTNGHQETVYDDNGIHPAGTK